MGVVCGFCFKETYLLLCSQRGKAKVWPKWNLRAKAPPLQSNQSTSRNMIRPIASQVALVVKNLFANARDIRDSGSIYGSGRSPGEGNGNWIFSSILSWRIPWTEEAGRLQSIGSQKSQTWLKQLSTHHNKQKKGRNLFPSVPLSETVIRTST